ncbi:hypothetical protein [Parasitella parasitica]|uniref:UDP-glucose:glycoprotein glucosyltransferase n=1 Tax=Parasitella parasitica TaxID=35722 RepID=A0A0B7N7A0_9FUNG|nr:hypothetical protein [Parasitella parasitica]
MPTSRIHRAILGLVAVGLCNFVSADASPTVDLTMIAPWSAPNLLIEVAETIATYNESAYLDSIHDFISLEQQSTSWTPHQTYKEALKIVSALGADETNFFKLSLAVHEASPRIEAYNQFYKENVVPSIAQYNDECDVWAQIENQQYCDEAQFTDALLSTESATPKKPIEILPFDHIVSNAASEPTVALYTDRFSNKFALFLDALRHHNVAHVIRYRPSITNVPVPLYLSGYGVEMALKKTDYLVIDDRSSQKASSIKDKISNMGKKFGQSLFQATQNEAIEPVTPSEIHRLGFKAAQYVSKSSNPLTTLNQLVQDFPKYAKSVSELDIDTAFEEEILDNQLNFLRAGMSAVWLNGKGLEFSQMDPFFLIRALRSERKLVAAFENLGFTAKDAIEVMSNPALTIATQAGNAAHNEIFDMRDTAAEPFVVWWNDLEKDTRYSEWTSSLEGYIRPQYPGQLLPVKRNVFNLIMIEDLGQRDSIARVVNELHMMIKRLVPVRFGIVSIIKEKDSLSTKMAQSLSYMIQEHGKGAGMNFLTLVLETIHSEGEGELTLETIANSFAKTVSRSGKPKSGKKTSFEEALATQDAYTQASSSFLKRMQIAELGPQDGVMFINGKLLEFNEERPWVQVLMPALHEITREIQRMVYLGDFLDESFDFYEYTMSQPNVVKHRNSYIVPSNVHPLVIQEFATAKRSDKLRYFQTAANTTQQASINLWVLADLDTASGARLAFEALSYAQTNPKVRIALIHNSADARNDQDATAPIVDHDNQPTVSDLLGNLIFANKAIGIEQLSKFVENAIEQVNKRSSSGNLAPESIIPGSPIIEMEAKAQSENWKALVDALGKDGLDKSFNGIVVNSRLVGPLPPSAVFSKENFAALVDLEYSKRIAPVEQAIAQVKYAIPASDDLADVITRISVLIEKDKAITSKSVVEENEPVYRHRVYDKIPKTKHTRLVIGDPDNSFLQIGFIIDPLSETAQKWVPLINTLATIEGVSVIMHLNPINGLEELPLKRFYRYVFDNEPHFDPATGVQEIPTAYFGELPTDPLYTLGVETSNAWHVTVREANMDLDNILLNSLSKEEHGVSAVYELENILLEGHCLDSSSKSPPRGLEFEIATPSNHSRKDTLVMANLGYFQLKALPGVWNLGLREGRSSDIYSIQDIGTKGKWNWDTSKENETAEKAGGVLALTSFEGITVMPLVHKNPGMESKDVLESAADKKHGDGLWSSLSSKLFGSRKAQDLVASKAKQAEINIFSVASGKLYERFLSIMIASVMKHTQSTVKFWFIENFLSPEFKDFVPYMAKEYGFDYEMVTYKWPSWLRAQREKQRTIWGYKILFLDVLFPLDLDKVIFVDADQVKHGHIARFARCCINQSHYQIQIVRTDLKELVDMDLQGAPYGYTPFCSDRTEMDGFRFWSEGYWKSHLRGKPYHISALYVVDLVRFRQLAAGDRLRAQYQQLSADPNSLANLDQDLPNNMQHQVPIFSLPQEWLWCETWCSDESLKTAKTIDLCNNPLTKEPKLDRARRQIPEWETYDNEIDALPPIRNNRSTNKVHSNVGNIHDSNEDILRIIKLYNHGTIKTINDEATLNGIKYPRLLKYRASNFYIFLTAALSIFTSIYSTASLSTITVYIIEKQIRPSEATIHNGVDIFSDNAVAYVLSSFFLSGLLLGSLMFGWLGCQIRQRKYLLLIGTCASILAGGGFMVSIEYWMLFPAKFLQGVSNASIWVFSSALIADVWPQRMASGLTIGGVVLEYSDHKVCFFCALALACLTLVMQICIVERCTIPSDWLETKESCQADHRPEMQENLFNEMQRELNIMEEGAMWSKSSSLSTINLRDQPIIFENEKDATMKSTTKEAFQNLLVVRLVGSAQFMSCLYQLVVLSAILGALKPSLFIKLEYQMSILNASFRNAVLSTFLLPCAIFSFTGGWLCDRFGTKIVGLTSAIVSIPAFIWIGVPNQNIQSVVSALVVGGITLSGIAVSAVHTTLNDMQKILIQNQHDKTKLQQQQYQQKHMPATFAIVYLMSGVGLFSGFFLSKLNDIIGFFWLCFIFSMLLLTCVPLMAYFGKGKLKNNSQTDLSASTSKKSIVNNTRPESFAESILSDDETTIGSSSRSDCNVNLESKSIIVIP